MSPLFLICIKNKKIYILITVKKMRKITNKKANLNDKIFDSKIKENKEDNITKNITSEPNNCKLM